MNDLSRELAPIPDAAWKEIELEATRTLSSALAARKLVDFEGPLGWRHSSINLGRVEPLLAAPCPGAQAGLRVVQPLTEVRVELELAREELDAIERGAADANLDPVSEAARRIALAEDTAVFAGYAPGGITGIFEACGDQAMALPADMTAYPATLAEAVDRLRAAGVDGPYAVALGPACYTGLVQTTLGGYPVIQHVRRILDGPIIRAESLEGTLVISLRGGDFRLFVGRDVSLGYLDHDLGSVRLYLEESFTFRAPSPEAAVPLRASARGGARKRRGTRKRPARKRG